MINITKTKPVEKLLSLNEAPKGQWYAQVGGSDVAYVNLKGVVTTFSKGSSYPRNSVVEEHSIKRGWVMINAPSIEIKL